MIYPIMPIQLPRGNNMGEPREVYPNRDRLTNIFLKYLETPLSREGGRESNYPGIGII